MQYGARNVTRDARVSSHRSPAAGKLWEDRGEDKGFLTFDNRAHESSATNDYSPLSRNRESFKQVNVHSHACSHARSRDKSQKECAGFNDVPESGPIVFGFHTLMAWKRKVDTTETYFQLRKRSLKKSLLFQSMKFFAC